MLMLIFFVGAVLAIFVLSWMWEILFARVMDDPVQGKLASVGAAYLTASLLYGLGITDGRSFNPMGFAYYLAGAIPVALYSVYRGRKVREMADNENAADTFR